MALSLEQLNAFVETVEQGGFKQAARRIGKHASTVSQLVAGLEIDYGLTLFVRHARSLELTEEGRDLYDFAKSALREVEHFEQRAESLFRGEPSKLTVAVDSSLADGIFIKAIDQLLKRYPRIKLKIMNGDPLQVKSWVLNKQADIGFLMGTFTLPREVSSSKAYDFDVSRVVPAVWDFPEQNVPLHRLRASRQIALSFMLDLGFDEAHLISHQILQANSAVDILAMIKAGVGWAHLPRFLCQPALEAGLVKEVSLENERFFKWYTETIWLSEHDVDPAMQLFIDQVQLDQPRGLGTS